MQDYRLLISVIKHLLREGKVIEAFEKLQELEKLNAFDIKQAEKNENR
jgi:hypothetical protein